MYCRLPDRGSGTGGWGACRAHGVCRCIPCSMYGGARLSCMCVTLSQTGDHHGFWADAGGSGGGLVRGVRTMRKSLQSSQRSRSHQSEADLSSHREWTMKSPAPLMKEQWSRSAFLRRTSHVAFFRWRHDDKKHQGFHRSSGSPLTILQLSHIHTRVSQEGLPRLRSKMRALIQQRSNRLGGDSRE